MVGIENSKRDLSPPPPPEADLASVVSAIVEHERVTAFSRSPARGSARSSGQPAPHSIVAIAASQYPAMHGFGKKCTGCMNGRDIRSYGFNTSTRRSIG